jgi:hypothetical protein
MRDELQLLLLLILLTVGGLPMLTCFRAWVTTINQKMCQRVTDHLDYRCEELQLGSVNFPKRVMRYTCCHCGFSWDTRLYDAGESV